MNSKKTKKSARKLRGILDIGAAALDTFLNLPETEDEDDGPDDFDDDIQVTQVTPEEMEQALGECRRMAEKVRGRPAPLPMNPEAPSAYNASMTMLKTEAEFVAFALLWTGNADSIKEAKELGMECAMAWHDIDVEDDDG